MKKSLKMDYDILYELMEKETPDFEYIDIRDYLSLDDYYRTDSHWRQECVEDVALVVLKGMDVNVGNVVPKKVEMASDNFYGVYAGQYMLPVKPDGIFYLTDDDIMEECSVINYEMDNTDRLPLYNFKALNNKDQYDIFAGGSSSVIKIYNPKAKADKKLIVFRDSFGSSIAPLFAEFYSEITLLDIRYIRSDLLGEYADFENADVLFLYSTTVINNSQGLK